MSERSEIPLWRSARREALIVMIIWLAALCYTISYCYVTGYGRTLENLTFVWGFPDWVFWGILTPWFVCLLVSSLISYFFMADGDLDETCTNSTPID